MKPQYPNPFDQKLVWRWATIVAALYAVVLVAMVAIIVPGDARHHPGSLDGISDEIDVRAAWESARATAARLAAETTGVGNAVIADAHDAFNKPPGAGALPQTGTAPAVSGAETLVENGWDFSIVDGVPGFGPLPQGGSAAADARRQAAGAKW